MSPQAHLVKLPLEILESIASQLPYNYDAMSLSLTCKALNHGLGSSNRHFWFQRFREAELKIKTLEANTASRRSARENSIPACRCENRAKGGRKRASAAAEKRPTIKLEEFDPDIDYHAKVLICLNGDEGRQDGMRCQGCLSPGSFCNGYENITFRVTPNWIPNKNFARAYDSGFYDLDLDQDPESDTSIKRPWSTYCKECMLVFTRTNITNRFLGFDIASVPYAYASYGQVSWLGELSFNGRIFLFSHLKRLIESQTGRPYEDVQREVVKKEKEKEKRRASDNHQHFTNLANNFLDVVESNLRYGDFFGIKVLYDRHVWMKHLQAEWKEYAPYCLWGLSECERQNFMFDDYVKSACHIPSGRHIPTIVLCNFREKLRRLFFEGRCEASPPEDPVSSKGLQWTETAMDWLFNHCTEKPTARRGVSKFLNRVLREYAITQQKFTKAQVGLAGRCAFCDLDRYFTAYDYAVHIFDAHKDHLTDDKWEFRSVTQVAWPQGETCPDLFRKIIPFSIVRQADFNWSWSQVERGRVCKWNEEKEVMEIDDRVVYYFLQ